MCSEYGLASKEHQNNPFIGYVNINSLCNKINDLGKIVEKFKYTYYQFTKPNVMNPPQMSSFKWMTTSMPLLEKISQQKWGWKIDCVKEELIALVIRQKGESQNGCFNKIKQVKFSEKRTFLTP